jgi:hypothetical protein
MRENSTQLIKICGTGTDPAAGTKSIGLHRLRVAASAEQGRPARSCHACLPVGRVFAAPPRSFYRDGTISRRLSGLSHLDNFIVTRKSCPLTGTLQKLMPALTQTATNPTTGPSDCLITYLVC